MKDLTAQLKESYKSVYSDMQEKGWHLTSFSGDGNISCSVQCYGKFDKCDLSFNLMDIVGTHGSVSLWIQSKKVKISISFHYGSCTIYANDKKAHSKDGTVGEILEALSKLSNYGVALYSSTVS